MLRDWIACPCHFPHAGWNVVHQWMMHRPFTPFAHHESAHTVFATSNRSMLSQQHNMQLNWPPAPGRNIHSASRCTGSDDTELCNACRRNPLAAPKNSTTTLWTLRQAEADRIETPDPSMHRASPRFFFLLFHACRPDASCRFQVGCRGLSIIIGLLGFVACYFALP